MLPNRSRSARVSGWAASHPAGKRILSDFLPVDKSRTDAPFQHNHFVRNRKLSLPTTVGITINMVRPGKRFGYQAVVDRYFSELGLIESGTECSTPPTASTRPRHAGAGLASCSRFRPTAR